MNFLLNFAYFVAHYIKIQGCYRGMREFFRFFFEIWVIFPRKCKFLWKRQKILCSPTFNNKNYLNITKFLHILPMSPRYAYFLEFYLILAIFKTHTSFSWTKMLTFPKIKLGSLILPTFSKQKTLSVKLLTNL
jgi:hypothetical protein